LKDIQHQIQTSGYSDTNMQQEKLAQKTLKETLNKEEIF